MSSPFKALLQVAVALAAAASWAGCGGGSSRSLPPEADCFNGIDDNGDGLEDCRDPTCLPVAECVVATTGFEHGTQVDPAEACPDAFPDTDLLLGQGLVADSACGACACGTPQAQCDAALLPYASADCSGSPTINFGGVSSAALCSGLEGSPEPIRSVAFTELRLYSGPCQPTNPITPTGWTERTRFCGAVHLGGGCARGQVCAPRAASHCAMAAGAQACPAGYAQVNQASWFAGVRDQRTCPCTCDAPTGLSCAGASIEVLTGMCADPATPVPPGTCLARDFGDRVSARVVGGPGGSCVPHGPGAMTGSAQAIDERTLCCAQ